MIDSRGVLFKLVAEPAIGGPMVAVGHAPCPEPHHALTYAPLVLVAEHCREAGAEVLNLNRPGFPGGS